MRVALLLLLLLVAGCGPTDSPPPLPPSPPPVEPPLPPKPPDEEEPPEEEPEPTPGPGPPEPEPVPPSTDFPDFPAPFPEPVPVPPASTVGSPIWQSAEPYYSRTEQWSDETQSKYSSTDVIAKLDVLAANRGLDGEGKLPMLFVEVAEGQSPESALAYPTSGEPNERTTPPRAFVLRVRGRYELNFLVARLRSDRNERIDEKRVYCCAHLIKEGTGPDYTDAVLGAWASMKTLHFRYPG